MGYTVKPLVNEGSSESRLQNLWRDNVASNFSGRYQWIYEKSPCGAADTVIAINDENAQVVGCGSVFPHEIFAEGKKYKYGVAFDFIVEESHRVFGPALKIQRELALLCDRLDYDLLIAFPNQASKNLFKRVGYRELGEGKIFVRLLNVKDKVAKKINNKLLSIITTGIINGALLINDYARRLSLSKNIRIEFVENFDNRADELLEKARGRYPIISNKNSPWLNWRYIQYKGYDHKIVFLKNTLNNELLGYCVFFVKNNVAHIVDMLLIDFREHIRELVLRLSQLLRKQGVRTMSIMFLGAESCKEQLKENNFIERTDRRTCYLRFNEMKQNANTEKLLDANIWYLLDADMDL